MQDEEFIVAEMTYRAIGRFFVEFSWAEATIKAHLGLEVFCFGHDLPPEDPLEMSHNCFSEQMFGVYDVPTLVNVAKNVFKKTRDQEGYA